MPYFECENCADLEEKIEQLEETIEKNQSKIEEYDRLKKWLLDYYAKPSDLITGLDRFVVREIMGDFDAPYWLVLL